MASRTAPSPPPPRAARRLDSEPRHHLQQTLRLVRDPLMDLANAELGHPARHRARRAPGDHPDLEPGPEGGLKRPAVMDVEALDLLAADAIEEPAVGEDAIHIEDQEADARGASRGGPHTILARRMSCRWMTPAGRPASSVMTRLVMAWASITDRALAARSSAAMRFGSRVMHSATGRSRIEPPRSC